MSKILPLSHIFGCLKNMTKKIAILLCFIVNFFAFGQKDSIEIEAEITGKNLLHVKQNITYYNKSSLDLSQIKLLNFVSAYKKRNTPLLKRKLEDRKKDLYYSKPDQQGKLLQLLVNKQLYQNFFDKENIFLEISPLKPGESIKLNLEYIIQLPNQEYTGYGVNDNSVSLKYFFLVPDSFDAENSTEKFFLDLNENYNINTHYKVKFLNISQNISSNLQQTSHNIFEGVLNKDVEFHISEKTSSIFSADIDGETYVVELGYAVTDEEKEFLEFYLPLQLKFIKEKTGFLPKKMFISQKFKSKNDFIGNDDLKLWKFKFKLFSDAEKVDMDYFSIVSQEVADQLFISQKDKNHWIINGIKTYLEIQYLQKYYKDHKLLGNISEIKILGVKPLKLTFASRLMLLERYGLGYQYIRAQNLDQKIDEKYADLSNFNEMAISKFESGSLFNFIAEKMDPKNFDIFLKNYISKNASSGLDKQDFLDQLTIASGYSADFLDKYIQKKQRINIKLKKFERRDGNINVTVLKNTTQHIPFKLETIQENGNKQTYWYDSNTNQDSCTYVVPDDNASKIIINDLYTFPEDNFRDNYLYTKGINNRAKKLKFKIFIDNPNSEINEIYVSPRISWNNYDKVLLGLSFKNKSFIANRFQYTFAPSYSTGSGDINGSVSASYRIQPVEGFFRTLDVGVSSSTYNYDFNLSYNKFSVYASMSFNKDPRSQIARNFVTSYNFLERELSPKMILNNDYAKYNLWNVGYIYSESNIIKEKYIFGNLQLMEDFTKLTAESYYRWEYAKNRKLSLRFYGGYFINNKTRNKTFDIGISRVSNYAFSYSLLAQSALSGILSQQFVMAEGGFKSYIRGTVNKWMLVNNIETNIWKMIDIYADFGLYKNRGQRTKFIWDSGIKLKVIPDFLEIYFPVQSSLGFEPKYKDYGSRIRFTFNLNIGALVGYFRRGWY